MKPKKTRDYTLRNDKGEILTIASQDLVQRFLKHHCPDGNYTIEGPDTDLILHRINGMVYPAGGTLNGQKVPPRSRQECVVEFGTSPDQPNR
jgi:hypothetical protein